MHLLDELECLTGKLIRGNITPIVFDLLTKSDEKVTVADLDNLLQEGQQDDSTGRSSESPIRKNNSVPTIEDLLKHSRPL